MTQLVELLADLDRSGIRIANGGDKILCSPKAAVTGELLERIRSHKPELLALLQSGPELPRFDLTDADAVWQAIVARLSKQFPPDIVEAMKGAKAAWASESTESRGELAPVGGVDWPPEVNEDTLPEPTTNSAVPALPVTYCPFPRPLVRGPELDPGYVPCSAIPPAATEYKANPRPDSWRPIPEHWR